MINDLSALHSAGVGIGPWPQQRHLHIMAIAKTRGAVSILGGCKEKSMPASGIRKELRTTSIYHFWFVRLNFFLFSRAPFCFDHSRVEWAMFRPSCNRKKGSTSRSQQLLLTRGAPKFTARLALVQGKGTLWCRRRSVSRSDQEEVVIISSSPIFRWSSAPFVWVGRCAIVQLTTFILSTLAFQKGITSQEKKQVRLKLNLLYIS